MTDADELLKNKIALLILSRVNDKKSISDIKKEINLTYKTLLFWIRKLEKSGLINLERIPRNNKAIIKLNPQYKNNSDIDAFRNHLKDIKELLLSNKKENIEKKEYLHSILKKLKEQRFLDQNSLIDWNKPSQRKFWGFEIVALIECGFIRERYEITKQGKQLFSKVSKAISEVKKQI